jgi:Phasin protein
MVSADENRPRTGSGHANGTTERPGKKTEKRPRKPNKKPAQKSAAEAETLPEMAEPVLETLEQRDAPELQIESSVVLESTTDASPSEPEPPATLGPVNVQAITDAYGDYTRKSIEQTSSFFEQLAGTRSLDKAFELQSEFARAAFDTFVDESRKIRELHRELAKQRLRNFEGFVMGRKAG